MLCATAWRGTIAHRYGAQVVAQMDGRITNRAIFLAGGVTELQLHAAATSSDSAEPPLKLVGFSRRVRKVPSAFKHLDSPVA